jgi:hypothetical protein
MMGNRGRNSLASLLEFLLMRTTLLTAPSQNAPDRKENNR